MTIKGESVQMKRNKLGSTDLYVSELGFGCASAWGKKFYSEKEAMELFFAAYELGINYFDTGHSYGDSEVRLGKCLESLGPDQRKQLVISTKCGTRLDDMGKTYKDWNPNWLEQSLELSMKRLGTDYIDILNLHSPNLQTLPDTVWYFLENIKKQKIVTAVGASCMSDRDNMHATQNPYFDFVMISYNILSQNVEPIIAEIARNGKGVVAGSPLAKTLYSNDVFKVRTMTDAWYLLRALVNNRHFMRAGRDYRFINDVEGMSGNQIALKYIVDNPNVTSAVFGTTSKAHLIENVGALSVQIPENIRDGIQKVNGMKK